MSNRPMLKEQGKGKPIVCQNERDAAYRRVKLSILIIVIISVILGWYLAVFVLMPLTMLGRGG